MIVQAIRVLEYTGPKEWVESVIKQNYIKPLPWVFQPAPDKTISEISCTILPVEET